MNNSREQKIQRIKLKINEKYSLSIIQGVFTYADENTVECGLIMNRGVGRLCMLKPDDTFFSIDCVEGYVDAEKLVKIINYIKKKESDII